MHRISIERRLKNRRPDVDHLYYKIHDSLASATLGRLIKALEANHIRKRDITYLRKLLRIRNGFIHNFLDHAPLPGEWSRYQLTLEEYCEYPNFVSNHFELALRLFPHILAMNGLAKAIDVGEGAKIFHFDDGTDFFSD